MQGQYLQHAQDSRVALQRYVSSTRCRREQILNYFGETVAASAGEKGAHNCGYCDNCCSAENQNQATIDFGREAGLLINAIIVSALPVVVLAACLVCTTWAFLFVQFSSSTAFRSSVNISGGTLLARIACMFLAVLCC